MEGEPSSSLPQSLRAFLSLSPQLSYPALISIFNFFPISFWKKTPEEANIALDQNPCVYTWVLDLLWKGSEPRRARKMCLLGTRFYDEDLGKRQRIQSVSSSNCKKHLTLK